MILPADISEIITRIQESGAEAFVVGGCVRDTILGKTPQDWDITTSLTPPRVLELFSDFKTFSQGIKHGTVGISTSLGAVEVTTFRIDGKYTDNRHPEEVVFSKNIRDDLKRRDFTINAMAFNPSIGLVDLFFGCADLEKKIIRTVGCPDERFCEDALRILRALRFSAVLGFRIHEETRLSILKNHHLLANISRERIATELSKLILADSPFDILSEYAVVFANILGVESGFCPEKWIRNAHAASESEKSLPIRLSLLLDGFDSADILKSLRFDNNTRSKVAVITEFLHQNFEPDTIFVKKQLSKTGAKDFSLILNAKKALQDEDFSTLSKIEEIFQKILAENQCFSVSQLKINGNDLKESLNISGKAVGDILSRLLDAVISEKCENTKTSLLKYAKENE